MLIDLFSGAGGLTEGFLKNNKHFVAHVEMDQYACKTLETRLFYHTLKHNYLENEYYAYFKEEISREQLFKDNEDLLKPIRESIFNYEINNLTEKNILNNIHKNMKTLGINKIEGIIGGPPCQAYSLAGRSRDPNCMENDPRNYLYFHYINFLKEFKPDFFVFENVPGMISAKNNEIFKDFINKLKEIDNYKFEYGILNSKDFNVLQSRKRLIVIGHKFESDSLNLRLYPYKKNKCKYEVSNILNDLPKLHSGEGTDSPQNYSSNSSRYLRKFKLRQSKDKVLNHLARKHNPIDKQIYKSVINVWNKDHRRIKYDELPDNLKTHKNTKSFVDRFKVVAGDLPYSHTIMAHLSKDGHYFIHPDINQLRSITVREAARIQSFPDNFKFEGPRTSQFKQVGNAVPPLMAEGIANEIFKEYD